MEKKLSALAMCSVLALGLGACTHESALDKAPGTYSKTTSTTDSNGTTVEHKTSEDVSVDSNGNKKAVIKSKTTNDPKGLFNKTTTESDETVEQQKQ